ncbi:hypothetical protein H0I31_04340 [Tenacibaculum sp. AHE15PA]|uniref:hypothetical protein n=1 Tax=unclassified Tenacibaculum TaxID=2635139 RepID=UPI001C4E8268|nr:MULTISPECIES: hypothetical protein [unclassified Tenacibaculum]QXP72934.1 hypothetical protein H0I30_09600 [Tenacibaculum sp. AHE14PA]QXP76848.1 hypothetical protein H0I31_04340 [Tenacibaculum sp. AHE15PA]
MKYLKIIIPFFMLLTMSCASQNIDKSFDSIKYEARTRGSMTLINVDAKEVSYKLPKKEGVYELSKKQLRSLNELVSLIKLAEIADLKAPTNNRATDMALIGKMTIVLKGKEYVSSSFDAGNPPKELKKLEDLLYSLIKN